MGYYKHFNGVEVWHGICVGCIFAITSLGAYLQQTMGMGNKVVLLVWFHEVGI